jgi:hypothetical protein
MWNGLRVAEMRKIALHSLLTSSPIFFLSLLNSQNAFGIMEHNSSSSSPIEHVLQHNR